MMFSVTKVLKNVYLIQFKDHYQLCMHFARFQEFYESPKYAGESFELIDLMEWYSKQFGDGVFSYPKDWGGFNIPGECLFKCSTTDENRYDRLMKSIGEYLKADSGTEQFYVIGTGMENSQETIRHEIAHGLYYTNSEYKKEMLALTIELPDAFRSQFKRELIRLGYSESVFEDEMQAYLSTGLLSALKNTGKKHQAPFKKIFNRYYKGIKPRKG